MNLQKIATYGSAAAVVGTGSVVGGNYAIDQATGGPKKRLEAEATELRMIVREEVQNALRESWPKTTEVSPVVKAKPTEDYRKNTPPRK